MEKQKWSFEAYNSPIADTGDFDGGVKFTNGKDILQTCGDEMTDDDCKTFCTLLDNMPDLWSHRTDAAEFENSILKKENQELKALIAEMRMRLGVNINDDGEPTSSITDMVAMWLRVGTVLGVIK